MSCEAFWLCTPREALATIEAASWRHSQEHRLAVSQAWYGELFARQDRLGALSTWLRRIFGDSMEPEEKQAALEAQAENARSWARAHNERLSKAANG